MSMTDLNNKRTAFNNAIDALKTAYDGGNSTDIQNATDAAKTASNDLAKAVGIARAANPGLPEGDFFSAGVASKQAERDHVRGQFIGPKFLTLRADLINFNAIRIGMDVGGSIDVDWDDGNGFVTITRNSGDPLINKATSAWPAGQETADIKLRFHETFPGWATGGEGIVEVVRWGNQPIPSFVNMFYYGDIVTVPTEGPNFEPGTSLENMFYNAQNFTTDISGWDVSNVVNMDGMFYRCYSFNAPIGLWDVSNVATAVGFMGSNQSGSETWAFDQDLSSWNNPAFRVSDFDYDLPIHTKPEFQPQNW